MIKYVVMSSAAKAFSLNQSTKALYRSLGNQVLARSRSASGIEDRYVERAQRLLAICDQHSVLKPGDRIVELGTGWLHWEATVLRLFNDIEATLYDVSDNRLIGPYREWLAELGLRVDCLLYTSPSPRDRG